MRKTILASTLGLAAGLAAPVQQDGDVTQRLDAMATELATTRSELAATQGRLDQVESYLQAQAAAATSLKAAVAASEEAGFTSGINPKSREILVEAWNAQVQAATSSVPGAAEEAAPATRRR